VLIRRIIDARMGAEIYKETVLKGYDPRDFVIFAAGGAGPVHCCGYAETAGMNKVVIFPFSSAFCAYGSSTMDVLHVYERSRRLSLLTAGHGVWSEDYAGFSSVVDGLRELARRDFAGEGFDPDQVQYALELDMKFGGQLNVKRATSPVLRVTSQADVLAIRQAFEEEYAQAYSPLGVNPEAGIEIHNFALRGRVRQPKPELERHELGGPDATAARSGQRRAYWGSDTGWLETPVYRQSLLRPGHALAGPAIVEAEDTTVVIEPGWTLRIGEYLDGVIERQHADGETRAAGGETQTAGGTGQTAGADAGTTARLAR
jgi:N-methylhydantoinase A/acetophenone carboxylase